ncbi:glycosyltransferase [Ruania halotolerans]|uniref:glycosyltransferase n=1 Tax=Ruania halotolerans TaxID=2897773 RepID=UPI001E506A47|nr:hypothetical protein [Ruania halotolerans]UFU07566.1 hypothetical protein LQF10_05545 [Ruania halotolerans]
MTKAVSHLDRAHALGVSGKAPKIAATQVADFLHRAILRGTYVFGLEDDAVREKLPPGVRSQIPAGPISGSPGELAWDVRDVEQRRAAMLTLEPSLPPISAVLVSRRPEIVTAQVARLARLDYDQLEIVVGLHGGDIPPGLNEAASGRPIRVVQISRDVVFGEALNVAYRRASGTLLTKVDDDDHFGPQHLTDLALAHMYSNATVVGKRTTVVHLEALDTTVRRVYGTREAFTHRVAGSTITLAASDFRSLGGWSHVPRAVDTALLENTARQGGSIYQPHDIGYIYVRGRDAAAHTWNTDVAHFLRHAREQWIGLLSHPAFGTSPTP